MLFFSPGGLGRWRYLGPGMKAVRSGQALSSRRQQMQLLGYRGDEILENPHLLFQLVAFSLPLTVRNQPLYSIASQVRHTARTALLAHAAKLTELVFRYPEVN
jgi:hypothetical protein